MTASHSRGYHLGERAHGGALFGLRLPQILLTAAGLAALVLLPATTRSTSGLITGVGAGLICAVLAFGRIGAEPVYAWAPIVAGHLAQRVRGRSLWLAPLPLLTGTPPPATGTSRTRHRRAAGLPRCLAGLELLAVDRPDWAGPNTTLAPVALIRDRRHETLTVVMGAKGHSFTLLEPAEQHTRMDAWGQVLAQFGRELSPVIRLGWTLWSAPATPRSTDDTPTDSLPTDSLPTHHHSSRDMSDLADMYDRLLDDTVVQRHDLRIWITVAAGPPHPSPPPGERRTPRRGSAVSAVETALGAAKALSERCTGAGLVISPPLSPVQIAEDTRLHADPSLLTTLTTATPRGLTTRSGLASLLDTTPSSTGTGPGPAAAAGAGAVTVDTTQAAPLAVHARWNCVQIDGAWHRAFWISHWPTTVTDPHWLTPLLHDTPCPRTLALVYEPISPRASRRKITADAVAVDSQLQLRERHDLRVPVGLQRAHHDIDQREAELAAGHTEVGLLALIVLTETSPERLDEASQVLLDQAAHAGIAGLRPLHARHDAAWACALPLGRTPDRELLHGIPQ